MGFNVLIWLFAAAVTLHNIEEAIWLPGWSQTVGRWHRAVEAGEFRFAVAVLTGLACGDAPIRTRHCLGSAAELTCHDPAAAGRV